MAVIPVGVAATKHTENVTDRKIASGQKHSVLTAVRGRSAKLSHESPNNLASFAGTGNDLPHLFTSNEE